MKGKISAFVWALVIFAAAAAAAADQEGFASWYGGKFHGRLTSNGEVFDTNKLTAAHKTLPFGSQVLVTNVENGKSVTVRINDRGPFVEDRIIDLSRAAADIIGLTAKGVARVKLEVVHEEKESPFATLQVASYGNPDNAARQKKRLVEAGFSPSTETTEKGLVRLLLENVPVAELESIKEKLAGLGHTRVVLRKK